VETRGLEVAADVVERAFEDRFEDKFRSRMLVTSSAKETSFLPSGGFPEFVSQTISCWDWRSQDDAGSMTGISCDIQFSVDL
jgi:hypothetical protein